MFCALSTSVETASWSAAVPAGTVVSVNCDQPAVPLSSIPTVYVSGGVYYVNPDSLSYLSGIVFLTFALFATSVVASKYLFNLGRKLAGKNVKQN